MAVIVNLNFLIVPLIMWQVFYADACPPRCVANGGACTFTNAQRCCSPICLEQYGICGKVCLPANSPCNIDNDCCVPLACNTNTKMCGKQCMPVRSPCTLGSECCSQLCGGPFTIKTCCVAQGSLCNSNYDCCSDGCGPIAIGIYICF